MSPSSYNFDMEIETLRNLVISQFVARTQTEGKATGKDFKEAVMTTALHNKSLWFTITFGDQVHNITVPVPYTNNGITCIKSNEVERAVCNHFNVPTDRLIPYLAAVQNIFIGDPSGIVSIPGNKKTMFVQRLAYSILNDNMAIIVYSLQKAINELVNKMPLHETNMNSWMMNNRLILIDPAFEELENPADRLEYQVNKNLKYYDRGWTSVGLSDGTLADKNYILTEELRNYTVFGLGHHNPHRNLYSTLGMKGDELPILRSQSAQDLIDKGITRKGWNWFTAFVDLPDTFEDQVIINSCHANKAIISERRLQCFGEMLVKEGQRLEFGTPISQGTDGEKECCNIKADEVWVKYIVKSKISVGGNLKEVFNVIIGFKRFLKDGTKVTNTHGNKGVIRLMNLGWAIDPDTGKLRRIDAIVSAKSIEKRKNHGQLIELLMNNLNERKPQDKTVKLTTSTIINKSSRGFGCFGTLAGVESTPKPVVYPDNAAAGSEQIDKIKDALKEYGFDDTCTWECDTYAGKVKAVCGTVFWGVIKDVEDQLWDKGATIRTNGKDLRTAGLKLSTVEFKALETRFGNDNAIIREVLSYAQGTEHIEERFNILRSKMYKFPKGKLTKNVCDIKEVDQTGGTIFTKEALTGTIADEFYMANGFILQLPVQYQTALGHKSDENYEGPLVYRPETMNWERYKNMYITDKLYVPAGSLRRSWRHGSGLYGMSEIAVLLNNIITFSKRLIAEPEETRHFYMLHKAIGIYFARIANTLSTKKGDISNLAMSVRYPYSAKAVATLSTTLPPHTIQIHEDMAEILNVSNGDIVITERFPCLGFMGVRPQQVFVTKDPLCRYTIRVSGNSLVSQNLDFDGDVLYVASFHTPEAKEILRQEWTTPNEDCWVHINQLNNRKGAPHTLCLDLDDYGITPFPAMTKESQAMIVEKLTGVKAQTGPVISLAYNLMRIMENAGVEVTRKTEAGIEMFIEKAGQSVFEQKHGGQSLHDIVIDAICTGALSTLIEVGFDPEISRFICQVITNKAAGMGIYDLIGFHEKVGKTGSNIINRIVRKENKIYFTSRSNLEACELLENLTAPVVDLPSRIFSLTMSGKYNSGRTVLDEAKDNRLLNLIKDDGFREVTAALFKCIDRAVGIKPNKIIKYTRKRRISIWQ